MFERRIEQERRQFHFTLFVKHSQEFFHSLAKNAILLLLILFGWPFRGRRPSEARLADASWHHKKVNAWCKTGVDGQSAFETYVMYKLEIALGILCKVHETKRRRGNIWGAFCMPHHSPMWFFVRILVRANVFHFLDPPSAIGQQTISTMLALI